jgi:hypothetical protein
MLSASLLSAPQLNRQIGKFLHAKARHPAGFFMLKLFRIAKPKSSIRHIISPTSALIVEDSRPAIWCDVLEGIVSSESAASVRLVLLL